MAIPLPAKPKIVREEANQAVVEIDDLYPGYGHMLGNALRRVLLSSLRGGALTSVKIEGIGHEFSTIEGVVEDVVELTLNLKQLRFRLHEEGPFTITLSVSGERVVTGADFTVPSQVELINPQAHIATLTAKKASLALEGVVEAGLGYVPVEARGKEKVEVGTIALDASFSPVRHVNYEVENMRVGDRTDYNRLRLVIETDGSLTPGEAFTQAALTLNAQFGLLSEGFASPPVSLAAAPGEKYAPTLSPELQEPDAAFKIKIEDMKLSSRTLNALREGGIRTVAGLTRKRVSQLGSIEGIGEKGIQEIKKALGNLGITLKS